MSVRVAVSIGIAVLLASPASAGDTIIPKLKAGMWTESQSVNFAFPGHDTHQLNQSLSALTGLSNSNRFCVDDAVQDKIGIVGAPPRSLDCSRRNVTKSEDGAEIEFVCRGQGQSDISLKIKASGDFSRAVVSEITVGRGTAGGSVETRQFRYLGPCTGGLKPGEIAVAGVPKKRMDIDLNYPPPVD